MEGALPGIGLILEAPAAQANPGESPVSRGHFAALLGGQGGEPVPAQVAGKGLPPTGPVLPPSGPLFRAVGQAGQAELTGAVSAGPQDPLGELAIPSLTAAPDLGADVADLPVPSPDADPARMPVADPEFVPPSDTEGTLPSLADGPVAAAVEPVRPPVSDRPAGPALETRMVETPLPRNPAPPISSTMSASQPEMPGLPERPAMNASVAAAAPLSAAASPYRTAPGSDPVLQTTKGATAAPQAVLDAAGGQAGESSELPFESIRVSIREAGGERPLPNREPVAQVPGPRQPVGDPQWARSLGERLAVVVRGEHQTARMSLNPAHLGPIEIQLRMQDDQAQLWLTAQHPQAREALESAMPRLREMFAQQGIDLSQQGASGQPRDQRAGTSATRPELATATDSGSAGPESGTPHGRGHGAHRLLDDYA